MDIKELYKKYGSKYSYACDVIAYFIFGDKSDDNIFIRSVNGVYGRNCEVDYSVVSAYMLNVEYCWEDYIEDIDDHIKNLETLGGEPLSFYF
jgi:hypothetical protein